MCTFPLKSPTVGAIHLVCWKCASDKSVRNLGWDFIGVIHQLCKLTFQPYLLCCLEAGDHWWFGLNDKPSFKQGSFPGCPMQTFRETLSNKRWPKGISEQSFSKTLWHFRKNNKHFFFFDGWIRFLYNKTRAVTKYIIYLHPASQYYNLVMIRWPLGSLYGYRLWKYLLFKHHEVGPKMKSGLGNLCREQIAFPLLEQCK